MTGCGAKANLESERSSNAISAAISMQHEEGGLGLWSCASIAVWAGGGSRGSGFLVQEGQGFRDPMASEIRLLKDFLEAKGRRS